MLNGCMSIFDPRPGLPTSIGPGKSYTSSMSPTMVFDGDDLEIVIGAPGATYIPQAITQALVNSIDRDMTMLEAVSAPRIAVTKNQTIDVSNRIPRFREAELRDFGYAVQRHYSSYAFAGVHGIRIKRTGPGEPTWDGGADPGRDGMALTV
jgi:gamma-glutamyltranspeptidase/glutathione hydrolase